MSSKASPLRLDLTKTASTEAHFVLDDAFFSSLNQEEVLGGEVSVTLNLREREGVFVLSTHIGGTVRVACDRCLDEVAIPVENDDETKIKFAANLREAEEDEEGNICLPERSTEYDCTWRVYETIVLGLPLERTHPAGECNAQMMALLESHKSYNNQEEI